jgi:hypothetical protein
MGFILGEFISFTYCQYRADVESEAWKKLTSNTKLMEKSYNLRECIVAIYGTTAYNLYKPD